MPTDGPDPRGIAPTATPAATGRKTHRNGRIVPPPPPLPDEVIRVYRSTEFEQLQAMVRDVSFVFGFLLMLLPPTAAAIHLWGLFFGLVLVVVAHVIIVLPYSRAWLRNVFAIAHGALQSGALSPAAVQASAESFVEFQRMARRLVAIGAGTHAGFVLLSVLVLHGLGWGVVMQFATAVSVFMAISCAKWWLRLIPETVQIALENAYCSPFDLRSRKDVREKLEQVRRKLEELRASDGNGERGTRFGARLSSGHHRMLVSYVISVAMCTVVAAVSIWLAISDRSPTQFLACAASWGAGALLLAVLDAWRWLVTAPERRP